MSPLPNFAGGPGPTDMGGAPPGPAPSSMPPPPGPPGGADAASSAVQAVMGQIRDLGAQVSSIGSSVPSLGDEVGQIQAIIKRMIIKAGQVAPTQTDSGSAVPMG